MRIEVVPIRAFDECGPPVHSIGTWPINFRPAHYYGACETETAAGSAPRDDSRILKPAAPNVLIPKRLACARSYSNAFHQVFVRAGTWCRVEEPSWMPLRAL